MKKILLMMAIAAVGLGGCNKRPEPLKIDNALTAEEIAAGRLTPEVMWKMSRAGGSSISPDGTTLLYQQTDYNMAENRGVTTIWVEDLASKAVTRLTDNTSNNVSPKWSADGSRIYFLSDRSGSMQVWEMTAAGANAKQLSDLDKDIEGFGVSPKGDKAWYVQRIQVADRRSSDVYKDMDKSKARIYDDLMARHWDYWDEGEYMHIFVGDFGSEGIKSGVDIIGAEAAWDAPLAPYFDMAEIAWSNAGDKLAYTCKPLTGTAYAVSTDSDIFVYDLATGETKNICKPLTGNSAAEGEACLDLAEMVGYDKYPVWSPDDRKIAFLSQRRAGNESDKARLFVYDCTTADMQDLTADFDYNAMNVVWSGNDRLYFIAPIEATHQICRVAPSVGEVEVLTKGDHDINAFTMAGETIAAELCTISMATEFFDVNPADGTLTQISAINKPVYDHIKMGEVQKRWVTTTDGKQMLTWVILPPDFDPAKKYPTLLYCQGGPQSVVSQFWSYRWNFQLMAAQGYIVVAPNRRGLPSFGQEWLDQISGDYSGQNIQDYLAAIDDVAKEPWADETRMGCVGASYGGYSVYFLAGCHEKRFKAFIAHCGIFDFDSMYGETEELFFVNNDYGGPYWDTKNATAQRSYANSPHKFVSKWDTPILIFTGEKDFRIPYTQSLEAFTAARVLGIPARLVAFENEAHQVFKPQNALVWNREFFGWLDKYVK
ncbi:S9 family peptidase [Alistipes sp. kh20]|uniref:S9 family peptidase n=1 Tax=Alistipes montrealensis TaxID=2834113 RepID=UPI001BCEA81D|nr:S9 family peptidase [Alistipes montrealensis]MBS4765171.1 S9 family peptidase [Alistipes montrealensis]